MSDSRISLGRLILVPALITLGITLLRLVGEINRWSPRMFNRQAGGGGALVGIVWLVPIFGIYFALKLAHAGLGPASRGRAIGWVAAGLAVTVLLGFAATLLPSMVARIAAFNVAALAGAAIAWQGWPWLAKVELVYGLAARVPVAIIMLIAMTAGWGTHYELGPPSLPRMGVFATWVWIGLLPQLMLWIGFTVMVGSLFGVLAVMVARPAADHTPARAA